MIFFFFILDFTFAGNLEWTCSPNSSAGEAKYPFCDRSHGFAARAADLVSRLNQTEQLDLWGRSYPGTPFIERLNLKGWSLDHTCIHGLNKASGVTVFPHAIAQGASWDLDLVKRISNATAIEARILSYKIYKRGGGANAASYLSCDGGPLANSAHDPRWGRISETYGEDPFHIQRIGVTALQSLQNPQLVKGGAPGDYFYATRQVTRHYIGYHGARPDIGPNHVWASFSATNRSLADSYFPTYEAFQRPDMGRADGIMCAMTLVNGQPSCGSNWLLTTVLRDTWGSDALIQSDCCDSIRTMNNPFHVQWRGHNITTDKDALALAVESGVQVYFGFYGKEMIPNFLELLKEGTLTEDQLRAAAERVVLSQMRLGSFDNYAVDFPFHNDSINQSLLDSPKHRALAREAAAKSTVLLKNVDTCLPLVHPSSSDPLTVAVIGPFANCDKGNCYLHSYNGNPSNVTTILGGIHDAVTKGTTTYSLGSNITCPGGGGSKVPYDCWSNPASKYYYPPAVAALNEAVKIASNADVTVLALGLGASMESEGQDRVNLTLPPIQQTLMKKVAKVSKKLVVAIVSAGGVALDETPACAVLWAPYGGEEAGSGLADILWGKVNPSGRLPLTIYSQEWAKHMNCPNYTQDCSTSILHFDLDVGVGRTYRYIKDESLVQHHFGYGLSYTKFAYNGISVDTHVEPLGMTITFQIKNTGKIAGTEVVQAYLSGAHVTDLPTPIHSLIGFQTHFLTPGEVRDITIVVPKAQLETAMADGTRKIVSGTYTISVGGHQPQDKEGEATSGPCISTQIFLHS